MPKSVLARMFALLVVVACVSACAVIPREHILMFDEDGAPVDPAEESWYGVYPTLLEPGDDDYDDEPGRAYDAYLDTMLTSLEVWAAQNPDARRAVVFIHGGLNNQDKSIDRAIEMGPKMLADGVFPIFVNWRSNLLSCYADHLFFVRQGGEVFVGPHDWLDDAFDALGVLWSPFQFAGDAARGILRLPIVATYQIEETTEWLGWNRSPERDAAEEALSLTRPRGGDPARLPIPIVDGTDVESGDSTFLEEAFGLLRWIVFAAPKLLSTIAVDTAGTGSWDVMRRRVALLFHREREFFGDVVRRESRGLLYAMERLGEVQARLEARDGRPFEIVLVGHSMGCIVTNHLLEHVTLQRIADGGFDYDDWIGERPAVRPLPRFDEVVYLGAACSVREYERAVFPYLIEERGARMYHVVLHPENEIGEAPAWDLAPRGSLLTWIDDFLAKPTTPLDRTAGRSTNLLPALHDTPNDLVGRIRLRILEWNDDGLPQAHGEFDDLLDAWTFWDPECWFPTDRARNL